MDLLISLNVDAKEKNTVTIEVGQSISLLRLRVFFNISWPAEFNIVVTEAHFERNPPFCLLRRELLKLIVQLLN